MSTLNLTVTPIIGIERQKETLPQLTGQVDRIAKTGLPVLIIGESGTGKEFLARSITRVSNRSREAFVVIDLFSVSSSLLDNELFGHISGNTFHKGKLELADKGTAVIKGIETMPADTQAKLLRLMQEKIIYPEGATTPSPVDVRILTTAKRAFFEDVKQGCFCESLYRQISANTICLLPLRMRRNNLAQLIEKVIEYFANKYQKRDIRLKSDVMVKLINYDWPGNFREFESTMERLVFFSDNGDIKEDTLFNCINIQ